MSVIESVLVAFAVIAAICIVIVIISAYRSIKSEALKMLIYRRDIAKDGIFTGESLELTEIVSNPTWFPLVNLRIEFICPGGLTFDGIECYEHTKLTSVFNIPPFCTVTKQHEVRADKRRKYEFKDAGFKYRKFDYNFESTVHFYAYPDCQALRKLCSPNIYTAGNSVSSQKYIEDPYFVSGTRGYRFGDPVHSINFKASARSFSGGKQTLVVNDYDSSRMYDTMIYLDLGSYRKANISDNDLIKNGLNYACYLFCEAVKNGGRVGFATNRSPDNSDYVFVPCESGEQHIKRILEIFAELNPYSKRSYSMSALLSATLEKLPKNCDIYFLSALDDEQCGEVLSKAEHAGMNVQTIKIVK